MKVITRKLALTICLAFMLASATPALAGPPLVMLDGAGGVGVNPTAWITSSTTDTSFLDGWINKPSVAMWYGTFSEIDTAFSAFGLNFGVKDRVELSWGHQRASIENGPDIELDSFGCKVLLLKENDFDSPFVPALSVGITYRTNHDIGGSGSTDDDGFEYYAVASKVITQFPLVPMILSAGVSYTDAYQRGVLGFNDDDEDFVYMLDVAWVVPLFPKQKFFHAMVPGFEYRSGADYDNDWRDADTWDVFADFMVTDNIIIAVGYLWNGDPDSKNRVGFGDCPFFMIDIDW